MNRLPQLGEIHAVLKRIHRRWILYRTGRWLVSGLALSLGFFWLLVGVEYFRGLSVPARIVLWIAVAALLTAGLGLFLRAWFGRVPHRQRALDLERYAPELREQLITSVEIDANDRLAGLGYAPWLFAQTVGRAAQALSALDLRRFWSRAGLGRALRILAAGVAVSIVLGWIFARPAGRTLFALGHPDQEIPRPVPFEWQVEPAPGRLLQYDDVTLAARTEGPRPPRSARLLWRYGDSGEWFTEELQPDTSDARLFIHTLSALPQTVTYRFNAEGHSSAVHTVPVVRRPELTALEASCEPPRYTGITPFRLESSQKRWIVPEGSRILVSAESDRPLASGHLGFSDSSHTPLEVSGHRGEAGFTAVGARTMRVVVVDTTGFANFDPVPIEIETVPDLPPQIALLEPGGDRDIPEAMVVPMVAALLDDYGFSRAEIRFDIASEEGDRPEQSLPLVLPVDLGREGLFRFDWSLLDLRLFPGDRVLYRVRVYDNRVPQPNSAETQTFVLRLPTLDEIIAETQREQEARTDQVSEAVREQRQMAEDLREMARQLVGQQKLEWEDRQQIEQALSIQEQLAENLRQWADEVEQEADQLAQNRITSLEMLQKMNEISRLMREVMTPELQAALDKLREAMEAMTPEEMRQALEEFQMTEEEILAQLDRTLAQLQQMQIEQMMENMLRQAERLAENQEQQARAAEAAPDQRALDSLARTEQALQEELNKLQEQAQKLSEKNQEFGGPPQIEEFSQMAKQCQAGGDMSDMTQQMQSGERQSASQSGQQASQKLRQMLAGMQRKLMEMRNQMDSEQMRALQDLTRGSLELSEEQESMGDSTRAVSPASLALRDMARPQAALVKGIEHLLEDFNAQAKSNLFLSPEVRKHMTQARRSAEQATRTLNERQGAASQSAQYETMFSLNEATKSLMESLDNQSQCQGSCANQSKMHGSMQSLSQQQLQLNQQSQSIPGPFGLTPEEQASVQRLSGQQQSIQAQMRDLANQFDRSRDRLGRVEEIAKSMDEVIGDMDRGELTDATLERQRNIYNRMLDFQKSLQRQDFENRRESRRGTDRLGPAPDPLATQIPQADLAATRWERFKHEWYPPGFRALVKEYFETVTRNGNGAGTE